MPSSSLTITHCPLWPYLFLLLSNSHFPSSRVAVINQNSRVWLRSPNPAQSFLRSFKLQKQSPISQKGHFSLLLGKGLCKPTLLPGALQKVCVWLCRGEFSDLMWHATPHILFWVFISKCDYELLSSSRMSRREPDPWPSVSWSIKWSPTEQKLPDPEYASVFKDMLYKEHPRLSGNPIWSRLLHRNGKWDIFTKYSHIISERTMYVALYVEYRQ